jgi:hypothetical protein
MKPLFAQNGRQIGLRDFVSFLAELLADFSQSLVLAAERPYAFPDGFTLWCGFPPGTSRREKLGEIWIRREVADHGLNGTGVEPEVIRNRLRGLSLQEVGTADFKAAMHPVRVLEQRCQFVGSSHSQMSVK